MLENMNIKVVDLVFGPLADYYLFKTKEMENKSVAVINIGEYKTEIATIEDGILTASEVFDLGGRNIDRDISYIYDITLEKSKNLKETFALAHKSKSNTSETIEVENKEGKIVSINQYEISEIVNSRIREILESAKKSINILTKSEISYIIITGGSTEIEGFSKIYQEIFGKDSVFTTVNVLGVRDNKFSSSAGAVKFYSEKLNFRDKNAITINEEDEKIIINNKKKINENSLLGKIYSYFFDN